MGVAALIGVIGWSGACCEGPNRARPKQRSGKVCRRMPYTQSAPSLSPKLDSARYCDEAVVNAAVVFAALVHPLRHDVGLPWPLGATISTIGLELLGLKATGTPVPIWYPVRLLGHPRGAAPDLRDHGHDRAAVAQERVARSSIDDLDWTFLSMLWIAGVTGFFLELGFNLPPLRHGATRCSSSTSRRRDGRLVLLVPFGKFGPTFFSIGRSALRHQVAWLTRSRSHRSDRAGT